MPVKAGSATAGGTRSPGDADVAELKHRWGVAEQTATDYGFSVAHDRGLNPTDKERFLLVDVGNVYRGALRDPDSVKGITGTAAMGCGGFALGDGGNGAYYCARSLGDMFYNEIDPRTSGATFKNAEQLWHMGDLPRSAIQFYLDVTT